MSRTLPAALVAGLLVLAAVASAAAAQAFVLTPTPTAAGATTLTPTAATIPASVSTNLVPLAWGGNRYGQLGDGSTTGRLSPIRVSTLSGVTAVAGGTNHSLALSSAGTVWAWGSNSWGQLGDGTTAQRTSPVQVSGLSGVEALAAGGLHSVAVKGDGTVWTWGHGALGQLGNGATTSRHTPGQVSGLSGVTATAAGLYHSLALRSDGTVWAWGSGAGSAPVEVPGLGGVAAIAAGGYHSLALKTDGTVWAWGSNYYGQLGDGTTGYRSTPIQVSSLSGVIGLAGGYSHSLALKGDGAVWAWGRNAEGQLGDGTTVQRTSPVRVSSLSGAAAVTAGDYHSLAVLKGSGSVWAWGNNSSGQLGDGTTTSRTTPVPVSGLSGVTAVDGGERHTLALGPASLLPPTSTPTPTFTATATPAPTPTATATFTLVPTPGAPPHDSFAAAEVLSVPGSASGTTHSATTEVGEPVPSCAPIGKTAWYRLVPGATSWLVATTAGSSFDTVLALYSGSLLASLSQVACNDDDGSLISRVSVGVSAGQTYYLQLGGYEGAGGSFVLQVALEGTPTPTATGVPTVTAVEATPTATATATAAATATLTATGTPAPTPTAAVTPTATPTATGTDEVSVGIQPSTVAVAPGATVTVALQANLAGASLGAWLVDVDYDSTVVAATDCASTVSTCNPAFATSTVRVAGAAAPALGGTQTLASLTFRAIGAAGASSPLTVTIRDFADGSATTLAATAKHGTIAVASPPTVVSVSPSSGPGRGGTLVTLGGANFQSGASATFGGRAATEVAVASASSLSARTPASSRTVGDVNGNGNVTAVDALCVLRLVAALPEVANCLASVLQTIVDVVVTNPDGQSGTLAGGYTYQHADVNGSGATTALDALCVLRSVAALPATTSCPAAGTPTATPSPVPGP